MELQCRIFSAGGSFTLNALDLEGMILTGVFPMFSAKWRGTLPLHDYLSRALIRDERRVATLMRSEPPLTTYGTSGGWVWG